MRATEWNQKTIAEFHEKKGLGVGMWGDHVLLMTAKGSRTGDEITTPLVYGRDGDDYVIIASRGGAPQNPKWFANIKHNPDVEVEVGDGKRTETFLAHARVVEDRAERDRLYEAMIQIWPSFADYQKRTERLIPVIRLERRQV